MSSKRRCKYCGFYSYDMIKINTGSFCNTAHAISWARKKAEKDLERKAKKAEADDNKKHAIKKREFYDNDRPTRIKAAQTSFNTFIRQRDVSLPCISCGRSTGCKMNAGHFKSVGSHPELRFEELNCHLQCEHCNSFKSGNIAEYIPNLIKKIGVEKYNWIEGPHQAKKYTCADLKAIELHYKDKLKALSGYKNRDSAG